MTEKGNKKLKKEIIWEEDIIEVECTKEMKLLLFLDL